MGEKLKELRAESKLTQEELAKKLQISRSALALYETNKRQIPHDILKKLCEFFCVPTDYFFGMKGF